MRTALLVLLTACAHNAAPASGPGHALTAPSASAESAVRFGPATTPAAPDAGVLLRLGSAAVGADQAGTDRLPPPGASINLEVEDADLHSVLRLLSDVSGLDFVVDEGVRARITVALRDVPWNHALLAILDAHGLAAAPLPGGGGIAVVAAR
jgi:type IV pilus assembly protein PilQ